MWIRPHAPCTFRRQFRDFGNELPIPVKQLFRLVTLHPLFEDGHVFRFTLQVGDRHLMSAPGSFNRFAVYKFGTSPSFWTAQNNHWPGRWLDGSAGASLALDDADFLNDSIQSGYHQLMH